MNMHQTLKNAVFPPDQKLPPMVLNGHAAIVQGPLNVPTNEIIEYELLNAAAAELQRRGRDYHRMSVVERTEFNRRALKVCKALQKLGIHMAFTVNV